jgi:hypothetical protein
MTAYWIVVCENCITAIPLLEYDPKKHRQGPAEFQATCPRCKQSAMFRESEIEPPRQMGVLAGFVPVKGFQNVSQ